MASTVRDKVATITGIEDKYERALALIDKVKALQFSLQSARTLNSSAEIIQKQINELGECVAHLNNLQYSQRLTQLFARIDEPNTINEIVSYISSEAYQVQFADLKNLNDLTREFQATKEKNIPTTDSHDLNQLLKNQRTAVDQLTKINQLRATLKNGVEDTIRTNLSSVIPEVQIEQLLQHRATQAELQRIISRLSLSPHQSLSNLTHEVAQTIIDTNDRRLSLLIKLADQSKHGEILQNNLEQKINADPESMRAFGLIQGKDSNSIQKSLHAATIRDVSNHNQPQFQQQIAAILNEYQLQDESFVKNVTTELLTNDTITQDAAADIIRKHLGATTFNQLPSTAQQQLIDTFTTNFEVHALDNQNIVDIRASIAAENLTAAEFESLVIKNSAGQKTSSSIIDDAYNTPYNLKFPSLEQVRIIEQVANNPQLLSDPTTYQQFFTGSYNSPSELAQILRERFFAPSNPTLAYQNSFTSSVRQWASQLSSSFKVKQSEFMTGAKQFFDPLIKAGSKINLGSFGKSLSGISTQIGSFLKTALPELAKSFTALIKSMGAFFSEAGAALIASAEVWVPIVVIGIILLLLLLVVLPTGGPMDIARSNIPTTGGSTNASSSAGIGYCDPTADPALCTPTVCEGSCNCPVSGGRISQGPGGHYSHISKYTGAAVNAIDFAVPNDTAVRSITAGTVTFAGYSTSGYGNLVIITNNDGTQLYYGHLDAYLVKVGDAVTAKQQIGLSDNTGTSSGPHLHLEYRGSGSQNILNFFNFTAAELSTLNGCDDVSKSCGGIVCPD